MSAMSRRKGARVEREVAQKLDLLLGIRFDRNLEQTRSGGGDLIADDATFPFSIEIKARASGVSCLNAWKDQASAAAVKCGKIPAVVFKFDRQPIRVAVPLACLCGGKCDDPSEWAEITLEGFAYAARELMAGAVNVQD